MEIIALLLIAIFSFVIVKIHLSKRRRAYLLQKYTDEKIVDAIMKKLIWQGMSEEQLLDAWGAPSAKDNKQYKTKISTTYKYNKTGKNRFRSRVIVENGTVVGWSQR